METAIVNLEVSQTLNVILYLAIGENKYSYSTSIYKYKTLCPNSHTTL